MVILSSTKLQKPAMSVFEIKRRGDKKELLILNNYQIFNTLGGFVYTIMAVTFTVFCIMLIPDIRGYFLALGLIYVAYLLSNIKYIRKTCERITARIQNKILIFIDNHRKFFHYFVINSDSSDAIVISSSEELENIIESSKETLSDQQRRIIAGSLSFYHKTVKQYMTNRDKVMTVKGSEILGPLVLDKLYKSHQDYALVIGKNIDEVKGILPLKDLLMVEADNDNTKTAMKAAKKPPCYIMQNAFLGEALALMLDNDVNVLVVTDKNKNTTGVITLKSILNLLFD